MNAIEQMLQDRDDPQRRAAATLDAAKAAGVWQLRGERPEVRLLAFDRWVRIQLDSRLDWTWAGVQRERRIGQCRVELERLVLDLWRRGWMLDGRQLADRIIAVLDAVGERQKKGPIEDFWAYFKSSVGRYVGANAEEIQHEARRVGAHVGGIVAALGFGKPQQGPALPELVAQRAQEVAGGQQAALRAKLTKERARLAADEQQARLF